MGHPAQVGSFSMIVISGLVVIVGLIIHWAGLRLHVRDLKAHPTSLNSYSKAYKYTKYSGIANIYGLHFSINGPSPYEAQA